MSTVFKDHFSGLADSYAEARPRYPQALIDRLVEGLPDGAAAWDCGCGSGQLSLGLADAVGRVFATDASAEQIARARAHPRIDYRVATAEASGLPPASVDLVVVAQAAHWFDLPGFYREVRRVAKPGARIGVFCYAAQRLPDAPEANAVVRRFYSTTIGPWWPPERAVIDRGYADLEFPFADTPPEEREMRQDWTLDQLLAYIATWSSVKEYRADTGRDPMPGLAEELGGVWGPADRVRPVVWPIFLHIGPVHPTGG